jgi:AcrR family transcriptional regulator
MASDISTRIDLASSGNGSERYRLILNVAAQLFAESGYKATSIREIGSRVGLLGGSLYHHIKSKDALFLEIHSLATERAIQRISDAITPIEEPWQRLEAACAQQLEIQLETDSPTRVLMEDFRAVPAEIRAKLIEQRDAFEAVFTRLIANLPLAPEVDRTLFRIFLLSILNNVANWYRPGKRTPAEIARQVILILQGNGQS